ncbi:MAG: Bro-N domain-containing protein [Pseudomonadota bacterium]|nr:Bro-N domain-containing protein [Pseudomonadota bacterium]
MSSIIPFEFDKHLLRVQLDADGEPWFVANDVCSALTVGNSRMALDRLDHDEKGVSSIDTPGGKQEMAVVNESGLYALILGSRKPEAKRFKRWVTHEVLPSIRKTGSYAHPGSVVALPAPTQDRVSALLLIGEAVAKVPGVKSGIAMAATLSCIQENTGLAVEILRRALPTLDEPLAAVNPTKLGEQIGLTARNVNLRLAALGFQRRNDRDEWELTEAGRTWGEALPYSRNGHSGYQILWKSEVAEMLREVA